MGRRWERGRGRRGRRKIGRGRIDGRSSRVVDDIDWGYDLGGGFVLVLCTLLYVLVSR